VIQDATVQNYTIDYLVLLYYKGIPTNENKFFLFAINVFTVVSFRDFYFCDFYFRDFHSKLTQIVHKPVYFFNFNNNNNHSNGYIFEQYKTVSSHYLKRCKVTRIFYFNK
jgi:hypothetical protein